MSDLVYVVTSSINEKNGFYKVGIHTGDQKKLLTRYKTPLIDPMIRFSISSPNAAIIEREVLKKLKNYRVTDASGKDSEWLNYDLIELISAIMGFKIKYDGVIIKNGNSNIENQLCQNPKDVDFFELDEYVRKSLGQVNIKYIKCCHNNCKNYCSDYCMVDNCDVIEHIHKPDHLRFDFSFNNINQNKRILDLFAIYYKHKYPIMYCTKGNCTIFFMSIENYNRFDCWGYDIDLLESECNYNKEYTCNGTVNILKDILQKEMSLSIMDRCSKPKISIIQPAKQDSTSMTKEELQKRLLRDRH
jgi:hypothetical protein